jgi:hypothetical protein
MHRTPSLYLNTWFSLHKQHYINCTHGFTSHVALPHCVDLRVVVERGAGDRAAQHAVLAGVCAGGVVARSGVGHTGGRLTWCISSDDDDSGDDEEEEGLTYSYYHRRTRSSSLSFSTLCC